MFQPPSNWTGRRYLSVAGALDGAVRKPDSVMLRGFETISRSPSAETGSSAHLMDCHLPSAGDGSTAALRCQQLVEGIDFGVKRNKISLAGGTRCRDLPKRH